MEANNENKEDAKSQIEKIRIDLEKKLAALEAAKMNSEKLKVSGNVTPKDGKEIIEEKTSVDKEVNKTSINGIDNQNSINQNLQEKPKNKIENDNYDSNKLFAEESAFFEINDEIKDLTENKINKLDKKETVDKVAPVIPVPLVKKPQIKQPSKENPIVVKETKEKPIVVKENKEKDRVIAKTTVASPITTNVKKEVITKQNKNVTKIEPEKKSNLNKVIYALGGVIIIALGYFAWSFIGNNSNDNNKNNKVLSEYENRRYKDSIELADANNLLLDYESQHYIDSIALANQINVISNPNSGNNVSVNNTLRDRTNNSLRDRTDNNNTSLNNNVSPTIVDNELNNDNASIDSDSANENNTENVNDTASTNNDDLSNSDDKLNNSLDNSNKEEDIEKKEEEVVSNPIVVKKIPKKAETLSTIEKSPVYPGCEKNKTESSKKKCFISKISKFVANRFNSDLSQDLGLQVGVKRINVSFVIDKSGSVNVLKVRAQHKVLEKEALRVVNSLPKMKAGKKKGKSEPVYYNLPIVYKVEY